MLDCVSIGCLKIESAGQSLLDGVAVNLQMSQVLKTVAFWHCDDCAAEWPVSADNRRSRQCPACGTRHWHGGSPLKAAKLVKPVSHTKPKLARRFSAEEVKIRQKRLAAAGGAFKVLPP